NVGEWTCSEDGSVKTPPAATAPVALEWSTGFENRFCDYTELAGFCYASDAASYELVTAPVHHGRFAAAFKLTGEESSDAHTRCVRQGVLPAEAYYGAWYYVPSAPTKAVNWNLFHFRGGSAVTSTDGFLDVSLVNSNGSLRLAVYGRDYHPIGDAADSPPFRTERWIHVQLFLKLRQGTNGGEVALYQDGNVVLDVAELSTNDSTYGQWYLGNLGSGLTPPDSTLYVDDVTISASL
ncbi:MAG TPA: heparin lyase I family protein, partial [Polyangiaceae bacterium]|nr:heparin lyase I family protein [Polyangiaceae bacterium]